MFSVRIHEHERGLRLRHGNIRRLLAPGRHWTWSRFWGSTRDRIEVFNTLNTKFEHALLDVLVGHPDFERALLLARGEERIESRHLAREIVVSSGADVARHTPRSLAEVEKAHIDRTLKAHRHNRTHAALELGIARATLIKKIKEYDPVQFANSGGGQGIPYLDIVKEAAE